MTKVDKEKCIGCGTCAALCPDAFRFNDEEGKAEVIGEGDAPCAQNAATNCPAQAITVE